MMEPKYNFLSEINDTDTGLDKIDLVLDGYLQFIDVELEFPSSVNDQAIKQWFSKEIKFIENIHKADKIIDETDTLQLDKNSIAVLSVGDKWRASAEYQVFDETNQPKRVYDKNKIIPQEDKVEE